MMSVETTEEPPVQSPPVAADRAVRPIYRRVELATNVAILVVAVLLSAVLVKKYLISEAPAKRGSSTISAGTPVAIPGLSFGESDKTLLIFLSEGCHFCTESAPFYRRLAERSGRAGAPRVVAVFPREPEAGRHYLADLGVPLETVVQASSKTTGVRSTPTLLLVDRSGRVVQSWRGMLPEERQGEVLQHFPPAAHAGLAGCPIA